MINLNQQRKTITRTSVILLCALGFSLVTPVSVYGFYYPFGFDNNFGVSEPNDYDYYAYNASPNFVDDSYNQNPVPDWYGNTGNPWTLSNRLNYQPRSYHPWQHPYFNPDAAAPAPDEVNANADNFPNYPVNTLDQPVWSDSIFRNYGNWNPNGTGDSQFTDYSNTNFNWPVSGVNPNNNSFNTFYPDSYSWDQNSSNDSFSFSNNNNSATDSDYYAQNTLSVPGQPSAAYPQFYTPALSINQTQFNLTDTWQLTLTGAPPSQSTYLCALTNQGVQSCSRTADLGLPPATDSSGRWQAAGTWMSNGLPDASVLGTWREWMYVGGTLQDGQVQGGIKSNEIVFTVVPSSTRY